VRAAFVLLLFAACLVNVRCPHRVCEHAGEDISQDSLHLKACMLHARGACIQECWSGMHSLTWAKLFMLLVCCVLV
jgi:hypothetical protein